MKNALAAAWYAVLAVAFALGAYYILTTHETQSPSDRATDTLPCVKVTIPVSQPPPYVSYCPPI